MSSIKRLLSLLLLVVAIHAVQAQKNKGVPTELTNYFSNYSNPNYTNYQKISIEDLYVDDDSKTVSLYLNEAFATQPFTPEIVHAIYVEVQKRLPAEQKEYSLAVFADGRLIDDLIPTSLLPAPAENRVYQKPMFTGNPWVYPLNQPYKIDKGLQNKHICVWQSHGKYFNFDRQEWLWQRPRLFCTTEDIFTQTFIVPYLIPMMENAGAVVYTPRERDWQKNEIIVDNDDRKHDSDYEEHNGKYEWTTGGVGFAHPKDFYLRDEDPFSQGTFRQVETVSGKRNLSSIIYTPNIPADGDYAVYVSYKTLPTSVNDAVYTVKHEGIATSFRVNQQMGGGTWVYLGTFHFTAGKDDFNCISLSNQSDQHGIITADAVRLGGGISNIAMADTLMTTPILSGLPRCLEAARYSAQWNGLTQKVYEQRGWNDVDNDIVTRPFAENYLARGSEYVPGDSGLCVPIELSMAIHSDAGIRKDNSIVGMLGIYTGKYYDDKTAAGLSRLTSRDLIDNVLSQIQNDIQSEFGTWSRRQLWDRNYGESREPQMPAVLLEMLSHQNWADMRMAHDPYFKFVYARSVYKAITRYLYTVHQLGECVIQPLPVTNLSAIVEKGHALLSWTPQVDVKEPTAEPTRYIIYTSMGNDGYDNGESIDATHTSHSIKLEPGVLYRFRVAACNQGGRSMLSDEVCALFTDSQSPNILIADGFQRLAGPYSFDNSSQQGFDMNIDPGVLDIKAPCYCGNQLCFNKSGAGKESSDGLGYSGSELEGMILAGNTHDYTTRHAREIMQLGTYNISSCTTSALPGINTAAYAMIDLAMGAQKHDGWSLRRYKTFTPEVCNKLQAYTQAGGSILVSGAYIGSDMQSKEEKAFTASVLKYQGISTVMLDSVGGIKGFDREFDIYHTPNEVNYWVKQADVLQPATGAFCSTVYSANNCSAGIAYKGNDYRVMAFGFPLENITDAQKRRIIIASCVNFLLSK